MANAQKCPKCTGFLRPVEDTYDIGLNCVNCGWTRWEAKPVTAIITTKPSIFICQQCGVGTVVARRMCVACYNRFLYWRKKDKEQHEDIPEQ